MDRKPQMAAPAFERRRHVAPAAARRATAAPVPVRSLQARLGNHATQAFVAHTVQLSKATRLPSKVSKKNEAAELEAEETARKVVRMPETAPAKPKATSAGKVQRAEAAPAPRAAVSASPRVNIAGGSPLPSPVRRFMEPRFGASFGHVRIHSGESAAQQSAQLGANAFTVGEHVFFGRDKFQPQTASGRELIAHELTHTIQQGAAAQRSEAPVSHRSEPRAQRWGISDALDWIAEKAHYIPGFRLLTIVLGRNPINWEPVERSAANMLRGILELIPVIGPLAVQALDNYGLIDKVAAWADGKIRALGLIGNSIKQGLDRFLDSLSWRDIFRLGDVYERGKRIFTDPIDRLIDLGKTMISEILGFIRDAILMPLAALAEGTRGYPLLKAVLGRDPITGAPVERSAETLIPGFLTLIGQEQIWENAKKANAGPRLWAWFQSALQGPMALVSQFPTNFKNALKSLEIRDLLLPWNAFIKVGSVFGNFVLDFISWIGNTMWTLLEIIFDVVSPGLVAYLKKTGAAFMSILQNPMPFMSNLVEAGKQGFNRFSDRFTEHLMNALLDWLLGAMPGVYIPKALTLVEFGKFLFSVLGLSWANIRQKLVKATNETTVRVMEEGFDIVVTLVRGGPAAAWEKLKEKLGNLKDLVINSIVDFVSGVVVKRAIAKIVSFFIPGAGFISAIISIYDTIMVFVRKLAKIVQVVKSFVDSIGAIANGAIDTAAKRVESTLAGLLTLAINFLAGFISLGNVGEEVKKILEKIRAPIDKALDWLVGWIIGAAKTFLAKGKAAVKKAAGAIWNWWREKRGFTNAAGEKHTLQFIGSNESAKLAVASTPILPVRQFLDIHPQKGTPPWTAANAAFNAAEASLNTYRTTKTDADKNKSRQAIDKLMTAISALGPVAGAKQPGSEDNAIDFEWLKPIVSEYPTLKLTDREVKPRVPTQVGALDIGVRDETALAIKDGAKIKVKPAVSGDEVKDEMNKVLKAHGYDRTKGAQAPTDNDHIFEKQLGGPDDRKNLWPLNSARNQASGSAVRSQIVRIQKLYNWPTLAGKWIRLKLR